MPAYYPPVGFHFKVEFSGLGSGDNDTRFQEVSGMTAEITTEELPVGGENMFTHRLPTRAKYGNLILKRGMLKDSDLISWFTNAIENFKFKPVNVSVYLLNENHDITSSWVFIKAYPVKWAISDFKAQDNSIVVETIELVYQYFTRK
jgi:phage tail-like protein